MTLMTKKVIQIDDEVSKNREIVLNFINEKKKNFEEILPELLLKQRLSEERNEAEVYIGYKA